MPEYILDCQIIVDTEQDIDEAIWLTKRAIEEKNRQIKGDKTNSIPPNITITIKSVRRYLNV